jgi:hypothetical protein
LLLAMNTLVAGETRGGVDVDGGSMQQRRLAEWSVGRGAIAHQ